MIEGLKIDVPFSEMTDHLVGRAVYHRERREFYTKQAESLRAGDVLDTGASNDPVSSLEHSARTHGSKEAFFRFLAEHVIVGETYRLSEQDLTRLEIVDRYL